MKVSKRFLSRIKITRNGKLLTRKPGHTHLNAKQSRRKKLNRKGLRPILLSKKMTNRFIRTAQAYGTN
ncbi:MAG: hypothetical protein QM526_00695 [Alphaproteobacteria bacterium]|nr:hypothetical protein [Alphaproteobacteria bacterium]